VKKKKKKELSPARAFPRKKLPGHSRFPFDAPEHAFAFAAGKKKKKKKRKKKRRLFSLHKITLWVFEKNKKVGPISR